MNEKALRFSYAEFIQSYPWDLYSTITFRKPCHDGIQWSKRAFEVLSKFDASRAFVAVEPHKLEGIHLHVLSRHLPPVENTHALWKYCFKAFGRTSISVIRDPMPVSRYCAKYVVKGNNFEFFGDSAAWVQDR